MSDLKQTLINIAEEKREKIIPENIKKGVNIFGVVGTYGGEVNEDEYNRVVDDMWRYYNQANELQKQVTKLEEQIASQVEPLITELGEVGDKVKEINGEGVAK